MEAIYSKYDQNMIESDLKIGDFKLPRVSRRSGGF